VGQTNAGRYSRLLNSRQFAAASVAKQRVIIKKGRGRTLSPCETLVSGHRWAGISGPPPAQRFNCRQSYSAGKRFLQRIEEMPLPSTPHRCQLLVCGNRWQIPRSMRPRNQGIPLYPTDRSMTTAVSSRSVHCSTADIPRMRRTSPFRATNRQDECGEVPQSACPHALTLSLSTACSGSRRSWRLA
jgi:hypothetical protein